MFKIFVGLEESFSTQRFPKGTRLYLKLSLKLIILLKPTPVRSLKEHRNRIIMEVDTLPADYPILNAITMSEVITLPIMYVSNT